MRVFCYGTLKRGHYNNAVLRSAVFIREDRAPGVMFNLGPYPGVIPYPWGEVKGEVFQIDGEILRRLDQLEGHPHMYKREVVTLASGDEAYIYYYNRSVMGKAEVPYGDWKGN